MRIIKCDRCGAEIDQARGTVGYVAMCAQDIRTGDVSDDNPFEGWDFCDSCMQEIHDFVCSNEQKPLPNEQKPLSNEQKPLSNEQKPLPNEQKPLSNEQKPLPNEQKPQKKKPFPGSGPSIDVEKAQALRDAGWSVKQIAAELETSEPTVRKWTHEPEPKKVRPHEWAEREPLLGKDSVPRKEAADGKEG